MKPSIAFKNKKPMFPAFNRMVKMAVNALLSDGFDVTDDQNLCYPFDILKKHYNQTGRIRVWSGASDKTIFGDPNINHAFRAWHDKVHVTYNLPFTPEGEHMVMQIQQRQCDIFGKSHFTRDEITLFYRILACEIDGQLAHYIAEGEFPKDQRVFTKRHLQGRM